MSSELTHTLYKPFKIIYKYRNANRKFQYYYYIYLGNVPSNIKRIITKFTNLSFFDTLLELSPDEIIILEKYYDSYWYENFFISEHMKKSKKIYNTISEKERTTLIKKMSQEWIDIHIKTTRKSN